MLIKANEVIQTKTTSIKAGSKKIIESQSVLHQQNISLSISEDTMNSYMSGDIKAVYKDVEEYVQDKMELLEQVILGIAKNNASYASRAESIDTEAGNTISGGIR